MKNSLLLICLGLAANGVLFAGEVSAADGSLLDNNPSPPTEKSVGQPTAVPLSIGYGTLSAAALKSQIPAGTRPLIDYWMRDTYILPGPDGYYYLTGTTADPHRQFGNKGPHCWDWNDGIYLWRSLDLTNWDSLGLVWSLDKDATWQARFSILKPGRSPLGFQLDAKRRAVWAPELHYLKSATNWFIVACMNDTAPQKGSFILRSTTGKAGGPYENIADNATGPIFKGIDGSLFEDDDGTVWFVGHNHFYARMKPDMSGFAGPLRQFVEIPYPKEPYLEGAYVFKSDGKYHLLQAAWSFKMPDGAFTYDDSAPKRGGIRWSYDSIIADADAFQGPYGSRYTLGMGLGHDDLFQDKAGNWWTTLFGNPRGSSAFKQPFLCRPAIVPVIYQHGRFSIQP